MKYPLIILLILIFNSKVFAQQDSILNKAKSLNSLYENSKGSTDSDIFIGIKFFKAFPNNFAEFYSLYGIDGIISNVAYNHIKYLSLVSDKVELVEFLYKLINLTNGAQYEVDGVDHLQWLIHVNTVRHPEAVFRILSKRRDKEIYSFFLFYFDGIHPRWKTTPKEFKVLKEKYPHVYDIMRKSLNIQLKKMN